MFKTFDLPLHSGFDSLHLRVRVNQEVAHKDLVFIFHWKGVDRFEVVSEGSLVWSQTLNGYYQYSPTMSPGQQYQLGATKVPTNSNSLTIEVREWQRKFSEIPVVDLQACAVGFWLGPNKITLEGIEQ